MPVKPILIAWVSDSFKLAKKLPSLAKHDYDTIDKLMQNVASKHHINGKALHDLFGGLVASLVLELTSDLEQIKKVGKKEYLAKKMAHDMSSYGLVIKLADRLDNVQDIATAKDAKWRARYKAETLHIMDYIEQNRVLSGTHKKLVSLIRSKLQEIP